MPNLRSFILKTFLFCIPVFVGLIILELLLRNIPNIYSYKWKYMERNKQSIQHLVLGSSHAYNGVNTDLIPNAFNAANPSQTLKYDEYIFQKFAPEMPELKTVLITLSYHSLFSLLQNGLESWREKCYIIYWHTNRLKSFVTLEISDGTALAIKKVIKFHLLKHNIVPCSQTGYALTNHHTTRSNFWQESGPVAAKRHSIFGSDNKVSDLNKSYIQNIVNYCARKNIKVIIYVPPSWESYWKNLDSVQLQKTLSFANKLTDFTNVTFVNLLKDNRFVENDFFDADHLNEIGADKLTKILFEQAQQ